MLSAPEESTDKVPTFTLTTQAISEMLGMFHQAQSDGRLSKHSYEAGITPLLNARMRIAPSQPRMIVPTQKQRAA